LGAKAKPRSDDEPDLGPLVAEPPAEDARSQLKAKAGSSAAATSVPQELSEGQDQRAPEVDREPKASPALSQAGDKPANSPGKPELAPAPFTAPESLQAPDAAAKPKRGGSRPDEATASSPDRAEGHSDSIVPVATAAAPAGWVAVRNTGKVPLPAGDELDSQSAGAGDAAAGSSMTRDAHSHAAKDMSFEMESPGSRATARGPGTGSTPRAEARSGSTAGIRRVETVPHVVEQNENFWTISRQYYGSGRYYRALWKANADRCPKIDGLYVNDVIIIPPPEDLDPNFIDPPGEHARSPRGGKGARPNGMPAARDRRKADVPDRSDSSADSSATDAGESLPGRRGNTGPRTNQLSNTEDVVPIQRSSRVRNELDLPAAGSDPTFTRDRRSVERRVDLSAQEEDEPETRSARRPRSANFDSDNDPVSRPVYRVRPNDTLRTIARDTLGTASRANEILDLNRDKIDDPKSLIVGQMLDLPDDARSSLRRPPSR
jgi:nucleoid-associated protein YgaU